MSYFYYHIVYAEEETHILKDGIGFCVAKDERDVIDKLFKFYGDEFEGICDLHYIEGDDVLDFSFIEEEAALSNASTMHLSINIPKIGKPEKR